jgi:hypothetical protein
MVKAGERQWSQNRKLCRVTGKILFTMMRCPLADPALVN